MDNNVYMSEMMNRHDDEATRTSTSEGLEEGEVEGETLLIVESEDQASVDLSHDQSGESVNSDEGDTSWTEEMSYYCERCQKWIPASQVREQVSYLKGDNFFRFTCSDCSEDGKEQFERLRLTWQQVVMLAMYNLSLEGTGRQGYFRWKEDICAFIEKHWTFLLGSRKKTSTWWSTVAGCLSVGSPLYFRSGAQEFGEPGWWKLVHNRPPTMKPEGEKLSASSLKAKDDEEMEGDGVIDPGIEYIPPPSGTAGMIRKKVKTPEQIKQEVESEEEKAERLEGDAENHDNAHLSLQARGRDKRKVQLGHKDAKSRMPKYMPASIYEEKLLLRNLEICPNASAMTPEARRLRRKLIVRQAKRERGLLLFDLDNIVNAALLLVDRIYGAKEGSISCPPSDHPMYRTTSQDFRILDRYQTKLSAVKGFRQMATKFLCRLVGSEDVLTDHSIISPYTSRVLKPYIRRDYETKPPKLRLLAEIRAHAHKNDPSWTAEPEAPIDYCYVRPNHIPTINSMCHEFFWPGIDLSECLQYPDFSVVVLYKKVIVAFGFMVPDVKYNEAYISFLFVHPEWRRSGIATFMIYHLIQTCMGKDATLHVSASNSAMLLYQKFGFKTEEYILDFYDKYYPLDSKECKHAFFLRLRR
ncbi:cysteine-rich protein 2-binding protein isoform X3 [Hemicordylus capensis]|uniref:cysteine-rich protein 2-binding protein isoform X3 n=1 Tax=Hemicordylus capensis TaxID=884348 RepID=UPI0023027E46|nr:cysteine-rich protein 2-binding protein isoform X3 [Hemicordylus capensis]